jgi:RNA polymerase sigma-70 factor (ECF subfamily)
MTELLKRNRSALSEESDAQALMRVAQGDMSALGVVYDRHYLPVMRFAQRVLRDNSEAEDVTQEAFLTASRVAGSFDGRPSCRPWLYGITARLMLRRGRHRTRLSRFLGRLVTQPQESPASPHEHMARQQSGSELERALAKLSAEKRIVILMAEVEELSCDEIARTLEIPLGTVWTRLHHARKGLRHELERRAR